MFSATTLFLKTVAGRPESIRQNSVTIGQRLARRVRVQELQPTPVIQIRTRTTRSPLRTPRSKVDPPFRTRSSPAVYVHHYPQADVYLNEDRMVCSHLFVRGSLPPRVLLLGMGKWDWSQRSGSSPAPKVFFGGGKSTNIISMFPIPQDIYASRKVYTE